MTLYEHLQSVFQNWTKPNHVMLICPTTNYKFNLFVYIYTCRKKGLEFNDKRIGIMGEILHGIRVIKMYCWEEPFGKMMSKVRK